MSAPSPPPPLPERQAFFFDLDGTLACFELDPQAVTVARSARDALQTLALCQVPLAVISGRRLSDIDRLLAPVRHPAAGVHGAERRDAHGTLHRLVEPAWPVAALHAELVQRLRAWPGTLVENKGLALALHFRAAPQHAAALQNLAREIAQRHPHLHLQAGKCVLELKPAAADKGQAIRSFMAEPPYAGRTPVFVGDDRTDEDGFAAINEAGGISIKVGPGPSLAHYRLAGVAAVHQWLDTLAGRARAPGPHNTR